MQFALNQATGFQGIVDESPFFAGSSVDGGGRPLGPGSDDANFPPFDGTPGTKTGATNNWTVTPVTVNDPQRKQWDAGTPVPGRDLLGVPGPSNIEKTQQACDMIPGCQFNGGTPVLPNIETVDNGAPSIDSQSDNVLDGFVIDIDDFDECEMIGFNWFLTDGSGNPIGTSGQGNQFGFGTFNLFRPSQGNPAITAALGSGGTAALGRCPHGPAAGSLNDGSGSNIGTRTNPAAMFVAATILGILFQGEAGAGLTLPFQNALDNVLGALINGHLLPAFGFLALFGSFTVISVLVLSGLIHHAFILLTLILGGFLTMAGSILQNTSSVGDINPNALTASITLPDSRDVSDPAPMAGTITISGPSPWVSVTGPLATDGTFTATGTGTVAG